MMTKLTESHVSINFHTARMKDYPTTNCTRYKEQDQKTS